MTPVILASAEHLLIRMSVPSDLNDHQNCGAVAGSAAESMPSQVALSMDKLPLASSFTVQTVSKSSSGHLSAGGGTVA
jgi:hypothetical protein